MEETASSEELRYIKLKSHEEDRISALPDSIIHHILSFLDSTKEVIQTCVLSKTWRNQWTNVPVLIFDLFDKSFEYSSRFIDNTLDCYSCSKIQKFCIQMDDYTADKYAYFNDKISFAIRKRAEELILEFCQCESEFEMPEIIQLCFLVDNILSGSPVLESLTLIECVGFDQLVILSQYLKNLELGVCDIFVLEIPCPNLEKFSLNGCLGPRPTDFLNLSSLNQAILDFEYYFDEFDEKLPRKILQQLQQAKQLVISDAVLQILSSLEARGSLSPPLLNNKCLILDSPEVDENSAGIAYALRCSHKLEKLIINKENYLTADDSDSKNMEANYWSSSKSVFNCLVSHLKLVSIVNFSKSDADYIHVLNFIEFLLKNAEVLEKLVVVFESADAGFIFEVAMKFLSFPRCSKQAVVEFLHFK